jgi:predicted Zn-ribbon and HTH transcriptional regulator
VVVEKEQTAGEILTKAFSPLTKPTCLKCGHKWKPRTQIPEKCPKCHADWREEKLPRFTKTCNNPKCGHTWQAYKSKVFKCPRCQKKV